MIIHNKINQSQIILVLNQIFPKHNFSKHTHTHTKRVCSECFWKATQERVDYMVLPLWE